MCASLRFCVTERPKKYLLLSAWSRELYGPSLQFFVIRQTWIYTHRIFRSVILVSIITSAYLLCSSRLDWQNRLLFPENSFLEELASYWLLPLYVASFFQCKQAAFTGMTLFKTMSEYLWNEKNNTFGSAHFTIPLSF